jgi:hypothetical protein
MTMTAATNGVAMRRFITRSGIGLMAIVVLGTMAGAQPAAPPAPAAAPPGPVAQPKPASPAAAPLPQVVQPASPTQPAATPPALPQILRPPQPAPPPQAAPQPTPASPPAPQAETPVPPPHPTPPPIQNAPPAPSEPSQAASPPAAPPVESAQTPPPQALTPQGQTPSQPTPPPPAVVPAEQIAPGELTGLLGHVLLGDQGAELGRIVDLLVDTKGRARAVVIDVGGFMGVGNRKVAVAWSALRVTTGDKGPVISTDIPPDRIKSWADYIVGRPVAILGTTASGQ